MNTFHDALDMYLNVVILKETMEYFYSVFETAIFKHSPFK